MVLEKTPEDNMDCQGKQTNGSSNQPTNQPEFLLKAQNKQAQIILLWIYDVKTYVVSREDFTAEKGGEKKKRTTSKQGGCTQFQWAVIVLLEPEGPG